jgi:cobalt-zinc-cadmium efflux system outer membrane protein
MRSQYWSVLLTSLYLALPCRNFAQELPAPSPLPLSEAIEQAQAVSLQRQAAEARAVAAQGVLYQASRLPNPSLDVREENLNFNSGRHAPVDQTVDVFAVLTQPIETGGKRAARTAIAAADVAAARAAIRQAERDLTLETVRLYLAALRAYSVSTILLTNRDQLQPLIAAMTRRVEEGYTAEADLMKFHTEAARLDTDLTRAQLDFSQAATGLAALLNLPTALPGSRLVMPLLLDPPVGDPADLARQAVDRRPEIVAAQTRLDRARYTLTLEKARRLPDPSFIAGYKRTAGEDTLVTGFIIPLPVFDRNTGNIDRALAEEQAAALELTALRRQQEAVLTSLIQAAQELTEKARYIDQRLLLPAATVRNAARSSFREGAANILQLVDAERVYTEAQRDALALKLDAYAKTFEARLLLMEESH